MEEGKTMHRRWEEGILHLKGTKHQVHEGLNEYQHYFITHKEKYTPFLTADLLHIVEDMTCLLVTIF
jgi:hypothetical protein